MLMTKGRREKGKARAEIRPRKFHDPAFTADGERRAHVSPTALSTLWFNTGTLCNITCANCYIESSPTNDRLVYLSRREVASYLKELAAMRPAPREVGFTGGEPFMNPDILGMLEDSLAAGLHTLVLTNAMRPMTRPSIKAGLLRLRERFGSRLTLRVSLDHHSEALHDGERGRGSFAAALEGLAWLSRHGFRLHAAGRGRWGEDESALREGYARLFERERIAIDASSDDALILFPEMDESAEAVEDIPEITERCWSILGVNPEAMMCASSRMVVKRKGAARPVVVSCTLIAYEEEFEMGRSLAESLRSVSLNHPHCARFCVLGGGSCSKG